MANTTFLRLLPIPIDAKGDVLAERIAALNAAGRAEDVFTLDPAAFAQIPGSPFAYWVGDDMRAQFRTLPAFEPAFGSVRAGLQSLGADDIFIRAWWEVPVQKTGRSERWVPFAKGGKSTKWWSDVFLVTEWEHDGERQKTYAQAKYRSVTRKIVGMSDYFRSGLTYTSYTNKGFHVRVLPADCIFSLAGSAILPRDIQNVFWVLALLNSSALEYRLRLMTDRRKWEPGYVKALPINKPILAVVEELSELANTAVELGRSLECTDETTHAFGAPQLVQVRAFNSLGEMNSRLESDAALYEDRLDTILARVDLMALELYGHDRDEQVLIQGEIRVLQDQKPNELEEEPDASEEDEIGVAEDLSRRIQDLLMWCVGVAFGRWDVRMGLDPSLLPALAGPFDPLPRCSPGALIGVDGLPPATVDAIAPEAWLRARQTVLDLPAIDNSQLPIANCQFPLPFPEDGILVDDPTHPSDIVSRVRQVLRLLWGERADAVEQEACEALGVRDLRSWFRDPRQGFFAYHIKRYSKSRRKAPIYWLLQSERRNYAIWLYCHRLHKHSLYVAGRDYADAKVRLEETRLAELREGLDGLAGSAKRQREREIDRQEKLVAEVTAFRNTLDQIALRNLPPDLNDGVLISIAPLHPLLPWKEAERMWDALVKGEYGWSTMSQQMKEKDLTMVN